MAPSVYTHTRLDFTFYPGLPSRDESHGPVPLVTGVAGGTVSHSVPEPLCCWDGRWGLGCCAPLHPYQSGIRTSQLSLVTGRPGVTLQHLNPFCAPGPTCSGCGVASMCPALATDCLASLQGSTFLQSWPLQFPPLCLPCLCPSPFSWWATCWLLADQQGSPPC